MRYERLSPTEIQELVTEITDLDWFFENIYAELSMYIQARLKEMGRLEMDPEEDTVPDACEHASDEILRCTFEQYLYGELDVDQMQRDREKVVS